MSQSLDAPALRLVQRSAGLQGLDPAPQFGGVGPVLAQDPTRRPRRLRFPRRQCVGGTP